MGGDNDGFRGWVQGFEKVEPSGAGHFNIEEEGVRFFFSNQLKSSGFGRGFANNFEVGVGGEKLAQALESEMLVIAQN